MALDIHIGPTKDKAANAPPVLSLSPELHRALFIDKLNCLNPFSRILRLRNYYADTYYANGDINVLHDELVQLSELINEYKLKAFIELFINVCSKAHKSSLNIYCFSD